MKGSWDSDRDPLLGLQRGDPSLFDQFARQEAGALIAFFRRLGAERSHARDLSQEVFMKLFRGADTYRPQGSFTAFALRVAKNAWIDDVRHTSSRPELRSVDAGPEDEDAVELVASFESREPAPWAELSGDDDRRRLAAAIDRLPRAQAVVIVLAVVERRPYPQVAEVLDIPVGTVKSRVFNALRGLRAILGSPEGSAGPDVTRGAGGHR